MQHMLLAVLQQRAADAVHDALRHARRARRIENVERVVERDGLVRRLARVARADRANSIAFGSELKSGSALWYGTMTTAASRGSRAATARTVGSESMLLPL